MKYLKNQKGTMLIFEVVILAAVLAVAGFAWYQYQKNVHTASTIKPHVASSATPKAAPNPYAGWKTAILKYEQISYQYPENWTVTDTSASTPKGTGCVYPGTDQVVLTSPSDDQVSLRTGEYCLGGTGAKTFDSMPTTSLGQKLYITLAATDASTTPTNPTSACLSRAATQTGYPTDLESKNIFVNNSSTVPNNDFCYWPYLYNSPTATPPQLSVSQMENSADFATAKLIFESMKYSN